MEPELADKDLQTLRRLAYATGARKRTYHACTACRLRKLKCVPPEAGSGPDCVRCRKDRTHCEWTATRTKSKSAEPENQASLHSKQKSTTCRVNSISERSSKNGKGKQSPRKITCNEKIGDPTKVMADASFRNFGTHPDVPAESSELVLDTINPDVATCQLAGSHTPMKGALFDQKFLDHLNLQTIFALPVSTGGNDHISYIDSAFSKYTLYFDSSDKILEVRMRLLKDDSIRQSTLYRRIACIYLGYGMESLINDAQRLLFASAQHTSRVIRDRSYISVLEKFQPRLRGWKRDFEKLDCECHSTETASLYTSNMNSLVPSQASAILGIEYAYGQAYLNSIILEPLMGSDQITDAELKMQITTLADSCKEIIDIASNNLEELLIYSPVRTYIRTLAASSLLVKVNY